MIYIEGVGFDPRQNLATEQFIFDRLDPAESYLMLWQNDNAIIVGKHQNTFAELNLEAVRTEGITVVRRLSGGGAVYHDLGNLNFTFITDHDGQNALSFRRFCLPVVETLSRLGIDARVDGRNDMTVDGRKFSGNAQYVKRGRVMHHGTLLLSSDLEKVHRVLSTAPDRIESKAYQSVRSRVTNLQEHLDRPLSIDELKDELLATLREKSPLTRYTLSPDDLAAIDRLRAERYDRWEWNYGVSPAFAIHKSRRIEGCGKLDIYMNVEKGIIRDIRFYGDYFSLDEDDRLRDTLVGLPLEREAVERAIAPLPLDRYFGGISIGPFVQALCE